MSSPKRILIINLAGAGDIVISSPAIRALKGKYADSKLHLLTFKQNTPLVQRCPYIESVFTFEPRFSPHNFGVISALRNMRFDSVVNLYNINSLSGAIKIFFLLKTISAKRTFGRNTNGLGIFYNEKLNEKTPFSRHDVEVMLDVVSLLGANNKNTKLEVWADTKNTKKVESILLANNIKESERIICIHPGARLVSHRWPIERFCAVASHLSKIYNAKTVITGSVQEINLAEKISQATPGNSAILNGRLSAEDLAVLFKKSRLLIVNDTGPMHIANALGVCMIVISGNSPEAFLPYNKENLIVLRDPSGINSISTQRVVDAADFFLRK